ncbi:MAG: hypothetical protein V1806_11265 [Pseudomonadota bacterium]
MRKALAIILGLWLLAGLLGVAGCGGGGAQTHVESKSTTLGRELMDLQEAYKKGALSDQEYQAQRDKLLNRR